MKRFVMVAAVMACLLVGDVCQAVLKVGDAAPELVVSRWINGSAVEPSKADSDQVFVVVFWATWSGPCTKLVPFMETLRSSFAKWNVTFIGVTDEIPGVVDAFVKSEAGAKIGYLIAIDSEHRTNMAWMDEANQRRIPTAFVVQGGKIAWIGHPRGDMELVVARLCGDKERVERLNTLEKLNGEFRQAARKRDWKGALHNANKILDLDADNFKMKFAKYHLLRVRLNEEKKASQFGMEILKGCEDAEELSTFAWTILTHEDFSKSRDVQLAWMASRKAMDLTDKKDAVVIDTYARSLLEMGDYSGAIEWQEKAVKLAAKGRERREMERTLAEYRRKYTKERIR